MPIETLDILLGTLMSSFATVFKDRGALSMFYESHGRHPWHPSLNIADTVGWFTSLCPIQVESFESTAGAIQKVKFARKKLLDHGRSYMASRFHSSQNGDTDKASEQMEVCFNYTGLYQQFETQAFLFSQVNEGEFETDDPDIERFALFDIGVEVNDGRISVLFTYNRHMAHQDRITQWMHAYNRSLISLARGLQSLWSSVTIGDMLDLDIACETSAMTMKSTLNMNPSKVAYIGPCTPMQQHLLRIETQRPGFVNSEFLFHIETLKGDSVLDIVRFHEAWKQTVQRHSALRTIFALQTGHSDR